MSWSERAAFLSSTSRYLRFPVSPRLGIWSEGSSPLVDNPFLASADFATFPLLDKSIVSSLPVAVLAAHVPGARDCWLLSLPDTDVVAPFVRTACSSLRLVLEAFTTGTSCANGAGRSDLIVGTFFVVSTRDNGISAAVHLVGKQDGRRTRGLSMPPGSGTDVSNKSSTLSRHTD